MKTVSIYETGCVRKKNEDSYLVLPDYGLFAVADGMGGHKAGEVASYLAIQELKKRASSLNSISIDEIQEWITSAIENANKEVFEASCNDIGMEGMGTTLTTLVLKDNKAVIGHIGDSRIYIWRDCQLALLSEDHSMVNELVRMGQISEEKAKDHPHRNILSRALGVEKQPEIDYFQLEVQADDVFLLCTDGFSNLVEDEEITREFLSEGSWEEHLTRLKDLIIKRGAPDNFTAVCCILNGEKNA
ncbi:MAG: Stp1/IreP family PP2C-type Ser/Thr phosphatase [Peptococcaceae bacterium]|jgi:serine/threonine protein phosphatase PrpC|nr:Stp1/IreP family PP2C-type Ser/Thr phosphatase [Peptococcaceae bacterium]